MTKIFLASGGDFDIVKSVVLLSPVKLSIKLSDISNEDRLVDIMLPNTTSVVAGAAVTVGTTVAVGVAVVVGPAVVGAALSDPPPHAEANRTRVAIHARVLTDSVFQFTP